ncbi:carbohydrate ABC transporter permease [Paenibacillus sp. OV219]|uniref:carbohydrate ABC transporter permease n=1 Tax=Paenibacillus sp. OV219 TaxID=1884377 RepID=UPI0008C08F2B|nr:carbohydrate ABC transporter permease [Paenibacillus sp. OV219]SEO62915.1 multiple sugar transport system permease protein/putative aldouronate transport system permease protein [Paenibacillus sp. OV219]
MVRNKSFTNRLINFSLISILILICCLCLIPVLNAIALSFSGRAAANAGRVYLLPIDFNLTSYRKIIEDNGFMDAFLISVKRVLLGCSVQFVLTTMMAYPLSKDAKHFPSRNIYMWYMIFFMLFSGGLIPLYILVTSLGLGNSIWSLILPGAVPIFSVILLMNFFRSLPKEMDEAAMMDGAGPWNTLLFIYVPLSLPAVATVTLFSIVGHWNAFFDGLIYMSRPELYPLQTYIQQLVFKIDMESLSKMSTEQVKEYMQTSDRTLNSAKLIVAMLPILIIYPFLQRYFVKGIVLGSVKE